LINGTDILKTDTDSIFIHFKSKICPDFRGNTNWLHKTQNPTAHTAFKKVKLNGELCPGRQVMARYKGHTSFTDINGRCFNFLRTNGLAQITRLFDLEENRNIDAQSLKTPPVFKWKPVGKIPHYVSPKKNHGLKDKPFVAVALPAP